ncbi:hypothetical protein EZV62_013744 [Acer yangbiense]|uniref:3-hydroxyisobutyryl-CoA hydrolase n=1 Tax=Acer yangbiense TaxID=1000413 RepID=A0A5C7HZ54_9ROSI|nr:hypothetical protein EZV62_013744 [Acer yangbiense]
MALGDLLERENTNQVVFEGNSFMKKVTLNRPRKVNTLTLEMVAIIDGMVMGGGAIVFMLARFKIVTENTVFALPEGAVGSHVGGSYFLSRLPGYFGEYLGLTGARIDGAEMISCGLATHFVLSKDLQLLENALDKLDSSDESAISQLISEFIHKPNIKQLSAYSSQLNYIEFKQIRGGRKHNLKKCLIIDYTTFCHVLLRTVSNDLFEGVRAKLIEKDEKPKWQPVNLELVTKKMLDRFFDKLVDEENWEFIKLSPRSNLVDNIVSYSKL